MAVALFQARLQENDKNWRDWRIESAGTWAAIGQPASLGAQYALQKHGLNMSQHRSRPVSAELLKGFQLVLTMETGQKEALQVEFPDYAKRIYLLSEMSAELATISDPYGGTPQDYEETADEIDHYLVNGMQRIILLAGNSLQPVR